MYTEDGLLGVVKQGRGPMGILLVCSNVYILFKWDGLLGVVKQGRGPMGILLVCLYDSVFLKRMVY